MTEQERIQKLAQYVRQHADRMERVYKRRPVYLYYGPGLFDRPLDTIAGLKALPSAEVSSGQVVLTYNKVM